MAKHYSQVHPRLASAAVDSRAPALVAAFFGVFVLFVTGFAEPSMLHNATHDTRHAMGFPCH